MHCISFAFHPLKLCAHPRIWDLGSLSSVCLFFCLFVFCLIN
jgi:hypothetical protein